MRTQNPTHAAVSLTIWVFAELNAGIMAASIPALKATFESILRRFGASSGLVTSRPTYGPNAYGPRAAYSRDAYGRGTVRSGYAHCDDSQIVDDDKGGSMFEMHSPPFKSKPRVGVEARSMDEDQKHILQNQAGVPQTEQNPWVITKTVEYSVSDDTVSDKSRGVGEPHAR